MFKNSSIKTKFLLIVSIAILLSSILIAALTIYSIQKASNERIEKYRVEAYKDIKSNLEKFSRVALSIVEYYYYLSKKDQMKNVVKENLDNQMQNLFKLLDGLYHTYKSKLEEEELKTLLINTIKKTRNGESGYFWINDFDYTIIMHPIKEELDGQNFLDFNDTAFKYLAKALKNLKESGKDRKYLQYTFYSPTTKTHLDKASIVQVFKPYNWIIGTGAYISQHSNDMQEKAKKIIKEIRYGTDGYFWINDMRHQMIMHPIKPELEGKIFIDSPSVPFVELGVSKLQDSQKKSAFIEYKFYTPSTQLYSHKLSLVNHFKPWGWVIGTGIYTDFIDNHIQSLQEQTKKQLERIIVEIALLTFGVFIILILFAIYLTNRTIIEPLKNFKSSLKSFFHYLEDPTQKIQPIEVKSSDEFGQMSQDINHSIELSIENHRELSIMIETINKEVIYTQTDAKGIITKVSETFCKLSGFKKEELIGQPHYVVRHPDMPRALFSDMWKSIQAKKVWRGEIKNVKKDGGFYWVDTTITPKMNKEGEIYGYIAIRTDISDKKALEDKQNSKKLQKAQKR
ncbi:MAG: cache domain-containing protein [Campylobacterota bacterium]|nr:cache domain-containing protein [Campylobacterota bacterium]